MRSLAPWSITYLSSSSPGSPTAKAKACCLVSRGSVLMKQDYSSNPENPGGTRDSQVWPWEERNENLDGSLFSVLRESETKVQKIFEVSQRRMHRETESTRVKSFRTSQTNSDTMKACRKYRSTHRWTRFMASSMQAALHLDPSFEKNVELFKNSEFENIKGFFGIMRMMIEGKFRN